MLYRKKRSKAQKAIQMQHISAVLMIIRFELDILNADISQHDSRTGECPDSRVLNPGGVHHGPAQALASRRPDFSLCFEESITRLD